MDFFQHTGSPLIVLFVLGITFFAGVIKGVVGFGMPTMLIAGLGSVVAPDVALAGLILPTLATNFWQALRHGIAAAIETVLRFRIFLAVGGIMLVGSSQLVPRLTPSTMYFVIGIPITIYAMATLAGRQLRLSPNLGARAEAAIGAVAGFFGGLTGVWGPPTIAMLTAQNTEKSDQVRIQGVIYGLGALALVGGHIGSGVLRAETIPLSLALIPPALFGIWLGFKLHDRIDQITFKKVTLAFLLLAGLNLVRRGVMTF